MTLFDRDEIEAARHLVYSQMSPTPQIAWPLLAERVGAQVIVKHENHAPTGAFKVRGGITFIDWLRREHPEARGIVTATRGNHGQSQARAATAAGLHGEDLRARRQLGREKRRNARLRRGSDCVRQPISTTGGRRGHAGRGRRRAITIRCRRSTPSWCAASRPTLSSF